MPTNSKSSPRIPGWIRSAASFTFALMFALIVNFLPKSESMAIRITVFGAICLIYLVGLALVSWPLTSLPRVCMYALLMAAGYMSIAYINMFRALEEGLFHRKSVAYLGLLLGLLGFWIGGFVIGSLLVYVRRRYWPVFPSGHCQRCGYSLLGLPENRCPECGTAFDRASLYVDQEFGVCNATGFQRVEEKEHIDAAGL